MANTYKVLGQSRPSATTNTDLYTVPSATSAVCSTLTVCNISTSATFRVAIRINGASLNTWNYIIYDQVINAGDSLFLTIGLSLGQNDVVTVYSSSANLVFGLFGTEIS